jgi:hypothetical protein
MFQTGMMKTKYRWTSLNWVWHMTNGLLAMGVPPGAGGVVITAAALSDSSKRTKIQEGTSPLEPGHIQ